MITWKKSTFSQVNGCVELGWRASSFSAEGNCVELGWRTSSFTDRGNCVQLADDDQFVHLRNSNRIDDGELVLSRGAIGAFIRGARSGEFDDLT